MVSPSKIEPETIEHEKFLYAYIRVIDLYFSNVPITVLFN